MPRINGCTPAHTRLWLRGFLVLYVPFIRQHFRFSMLHVSDLLIRLSAGVLSVLWFEALKIVTRSRLMHA
jgi:hypothetical protein